MPRPDHLDAAGWAVLEAAGVRTLVDLRNDDEIAALPLRPATIDTVVCSIEDPSDVEFMAELDAFLGSPTYYAENLRRWPQKIAAAITAVADAPAGGVVIHCAAGRDRTGLIVALLLHFAGIDRAAILDDYEAGVRETNAYLRGLDDPHERPRTDEELESGIHSARRTLDELLENLDVSTYLLRAGMSASQLNTLRTRLLGA